MDKLTFIANSFYHVLNFISEVLLCDEGRARLTQKVDPHFGYAGFVFQCVHYCIDTSGTSHASNRKRHTIGV